MNRQVISHPTIWTVGHSTRPIAVFIELLESAAITLVADVRRFPASRRYPDYNQQPLAETLATASISYLALPILGGRRQVHPDSPNTAWRNPSFRAYADYMDTALFQQGIHQVEMLAASERVALMCSEAVWWRCHRALIADYLKVHDYSVSHLLSPTKHQPHPYTSAAQISDGKLTYTQLPT